MTKFTWLNGYRDTIHICSCDDISAIAEIDVINGIYSFYTKKRTPLMKNLCKTINATNLAENKKQCEEYLSRIHLDFDLERIKRFEQEQGRNY